MKNFELIDKFLNNDMDSEEKKSFELELKENEELAFEVELQRQENLALKTSALLLLKNNIKELDKENLIHGKKETPTIKEKTGSNKKYFKPLLFTLAIGIIALFSYKYFNTKPSNTTETSPKTEEPEKEIQNSNQLEVKEEIIPVEKEKKINPVEKQPPPKKKLQKEKITTPYKPNYPMMAMANILPESDSWTRNELIDEISDPAWKEIVEQYNIPNYRKTIALTTALKEDHPFYLDAKNIMAKSLLKSSEFSKAEKIYRELIATEDDFQMDNYQYGLLISLIGQIPKKENEFKSLFRAINVNQDFSYRKEFQNLKDKLIKAGINFE